MKTYIKFLINIFLNSFIYVSLVIFSLVFIINLLTELEFFKEIDVSIFYTFYLSLLNSPNMVFEIFPFIFLISTQLFYIKLFNNNEIQIFKYSGLKNSKILLTISSTAFVLGLLIISLFYNTSSNLKNFYLEHKSNYTKDGKYLAVINKNGLWIRDKINNKTLVINSSKIDENYLIGSFITEFDNEYNVTRNIISDKIDVSNKKWLIYDAKIYQTNNYENKKILKLDTNFDYKRINSLYSNLNSLNIFKLIELRGNYKKLNYSITELDLQLLKLSILPIFLVLMSLFSSLIMFRIKHLSSPTFKIAVGLFFSVIIYYLNNFFYVLGSTEKINITLSVLIPIFILSFINTLMLNKINEK